MPEWRYRGRTVTAEEIDFIRRLITEHPTASRRRLSEKLCEAWQWKQANGAPRDMVCRGLLLMLDRAGQIELPGIRFRPPNPLARRERPQAMLIDTTPLNGALADIRPVSLQQVRKTADEPLFNSLMEQHHYLGYEQPVGEHLKYLVWATVRNPPHRLHGMEFGPSSSGQPRPLYRMERRSAPAQHSLHRLQHALPDSAVDQSSASGFAHTGPRNERAARRLGADVQPSGLLRRDLHRSRPFSRNLLPRGQLGADGPDDGPRQSIQQLHTEPLH